MLGGALAGQKKFPEAEPLLIEGYSGMKERAGQIPIVRSSAWVASSDQES